MNSKLLEILKHLYITAVQDSDGVRAGRKGYRMRYDEVPEQMEKAIRQAVGEEMLELTNEQYERAYKRGGNDPVYVELVELRQKIKQWQGGEDE